MIRVEGTSKEPKGTFLEISGQLFLNWGTGDDTGTPKIVLNAFHVNHT